MELFDTITDPTDPRRTGEGQPGGCICFAPPCIWSAGPDGGAGTHEARASVDGGG